MKQLCLAL
ncbi:hypothetical protein E2C01_076894 [Portunus trituberculatus]|uniref:Uncharacterized protein n=1 Tax=Portunus trituberculatus TaxID=210409 RepID=A0A5B7I9Y4_PORTR|nr:hypothetical protein [Portunus trituberculatus]